MVWFVGWRWSLDEGIDENIVLCNLAVDSQTAGQVAEGFMPEPVLLRHRTQTKAHFYVNETCC